MALENKQYRTELKESEANSLERGSKSGSRGEDSSQGQFQGLASGRDEQIIITKTAKDGKK